MSETPEALTARLALEHYEWEGERSTLTKAEANTLRLALYEATIWRERHASQAIDISTWLADAGIGSCTIPEGVRRLLNERDEARAELDNMREAANALADRAETAEARADAAEQALTEKREFHRQYMLDAGDQFTKQAIALATAQAAQARLREALEANGTRARNGEWCWCGYLAAILADAGDHAQKCRIAKRALASPQVASPDPREEPHRG